MRLPRHVFNMSRNDRDRKVYVLTKQCYISSKYLLEKKQSSATQQLRGNYV